MKLVKLELYESDGSLFEEYMFWTEKPMAYFCSYNGEIKHTFVNWLKEHNKSIYDEITTSYFNIKVHYFDEQTLDII